MSEEDKWVLICLTRDGYYSFHSKYLLEVIAVEAAVIHSKKNPHNKYITARLTREYHFQPPQVTSREIG